ncbi:hypothetical protein GCM10011416_12480 [Polaribacter pacificus]|uniref:Uncharacterized protein n=1 Tax=Polaribacter pacificus TaxID=1775173 RepID=A0A917HYR5_9FLAO|nr:hypothetical protein [Polaribacter pacificus]GGG96225.1 hypothetical protein GCM10011416_12480 [Polaribacter pacificus]|tara:strand:+ start:42 stop:212 length:171 start_codon:yes stop_codon:yes gene_type:complete
MDGNTKSAIIGGTCFSSILHIGVEDIATTIILAVIGAVVSFLVSLFLRRVTKKNKS